MDLTVLIPDHCLSIYFPSDQYNFLSNIYLLKTRRQTRVSELLYKMLLMILSKKLTNKNA